MFRRLLVIAAALLPTICSCAQDIEPGEWMELPEVSDASSLYALSMHMEGRTQRNYSFLWNEERLTADWVAYPLCNGNSGYYSRGHQIPSADRRAYRANVQTFYGTNMTPQDEKPEWRYLGLPGEQGPRLGFALRYPLCRVGMHL